MQGESRRACVLRVVVGAGALASGASGQVLNQPAAPVEITLNDTPPHAGTNARFPGHRAPLAPEPLIRLPLGAVTASGWLKTQLDLMASGMFGHLPEVSSWCRPDGSAWRAKDGTGERGWEELPYWLKGFVPLAWLAWLADPDSEKGGVLVDQAKEWMEAVIASRQPDGWFGPAANHAEPDLWPNMPMLYALRSHFEATHDARVLELLTAYFHFELALPRERLLPGSWQKVRGGDNLEIVHWLYDQTGEPFLLELARALHERTVDWTTGIADLHGVNFCQGFREPAQFFVQSLEARHLAASARNWDEMYRRFGQVPGGMFGADEVARDGYGDPRQAAEACSMVEMMQSCATLLSITGDPRWAERCEDVAFNSLPAAATPNWSGLRYLTSPNLIAADAEDHHPGFFNGGCMVAYSAHERYRCCQHNVSHGWPNFVQNAWMATRDGGVAATLLAPTSVHWRASDSLVIGVDETTSYPFGDDVTGDTVTFVVHLFARSELEQTPSQSVVPPTRFPLWICIPSWCDGAAIELADEKRSVPVAAGRWARLERPWRDGDRVVLKLPMKVRVRTFAANGGSIAIDRGPLTYSLDLEEEWRKIGGSDRWPEQEVVTKTRWNYALVLDERGAEASFPFDRRPRKVGEQPFSKPAPIALLAKGRRVPEWQTQHGLIAPLQQSPVATDAPIEELRLVPMGCARLRVSAFPVAAAPGTGSLWIAPPPAPRASHIHDDVFAPFDGVLPASSSDHSVPRFTFWDHVGTVEWLEHEWKVPRRVSRCSVYWFDDTGIGRCRVPKSWRLLWRDGDLWEEVTAASSYGAARDQMNVVTFAPVTTTALRLEVTQQPDFSSGLFEWTTAD